MRSREDEQAALYSDVRVYDKETESPFIEREHVIDLSMLNVIFQIKHGKTDEGVEGGFPLRAAYSGDIGIAVDLSHPAH